MAKKIVITSGKGGVGKTTVTANLGCALAKSGAKVCVVDADVGLNNLDVCLCLEGDIVYDIGDVLAGRCRLKQAVVVDKIYSNLCLLASSKYMAKGALTNRAFAELIAELQGGFDYILIDSPAGIDEGFERAVAVADEAIVVTTPHISALRDADKVVGLLSTYQLEKASLVVNRARGDLIIKGKMISPKECSQLLGLPLLGVLPEDDIIVLSNHASYNEGSKLAEAYVYLAEYLQGKSKRIFNAEAGYKGILGLFRRK